MKNSFINSLVILLFFLILSCKKKEELVPPTLITTDVTEISFTTATSGGDLKNIGGAYVTARGVCWNTSAEPTIENNKTTESGGLGTFTCNITQLTPGTKYYVRAYGTNAAGTGYGNEVSFTTSQVTVPVLTTKAITSITQTTAISGGDITTDNGGSVTARGVCWSTVQNPTTSDSKTSDTDGTESYISNMTGLTGNTTYYVRAYAINSAGTGYGNEISFSTDPLMPTVTTTSASSIGLTTATSGGNVTSDGGATITARGVCWSISANPTILLSTKTTNGTGSGTFTSSITGLIPTTSYYVRAYATNSTGTGYGEQIELTTLIDYTGQTGTVSDIDGNNYKTIGIGSQIWMAENLKTTKYCTDELIGTTTPATKDISGESTPEYQWSYAGNESNAAIYGRLYTWYTVIDSRKICPDGWHIPSNTEWTTLTGYLIDNGHGYEGSGGDIAKSLAAVSGWLDTCPTPGAPVNDQASNNSSGFTALPAGERSPGGSFLSKGIGTTWWSASEYNTTRAWYRSMAYCYEFIYKDNYEKENGYSVRCVKD